MKSTWLAAGVLLSVFVACGGDDAGGDGGADGSADVGGGDATSGGDSASVDANGGGDSANDTSNADAGGADTSAGDAADGASGDDGGSAADADAGMALVNGCAPADFVDDTDAGTNGAQIVFPSGGLHYAPNCVHIAAGQSVTWSGPFASHPLEPSAGMGSPNNPITVTSTGTTATFAFPTAGTYAFECMFHGPIGMNGAILVTQ